MEEERDAYDTPKEREREELLTTEGLPCMALNGLENGEDAAQAEALGTLGEEGQGSECWATVTRRSKSSFGERNAETETRPCPSSPMGKGARTGSSDPRLLSAR